MRKDFLLASPVLAALVLGGLLVGTQITACNGAVTENSSADGGVDSSVAASPDASADAAIAPVTIGDSAVANCFVDLSKEDPVDFCLQKQILRDEHAVFLPDAGVSSTWSSTTGKADTDGGAITYSMRDNVAYAASLGLYAVSSEVYGDTEINPSVLVPDMMALAALLQAELTPLPASYDGELYMRLRRFKDGLDQINDADDGAKIAAIADAYGKAIFTSYFHALPASSSGSTDAGTDDGGDAATGGGLDSGLGTGVGYADGILGVPAAGGSFQYDVDQAASGALALVDLAARNAATDPTNSPLWAQAAGSVFNHLYTRARHTSGLYYADLVTSADLDHDALASVASPSDALVTETQASVAVSLLRASAIVQKVSLASLANFPFSIQVLSSMNGLSGLAPGGNSGVSLWDPTKTADTTTACAVLEGDAAVACGGSGFFVRYLPSTTGLDNSSKTLRGNALLFEAVTRSLILQTASSIDYEPLKALFQSTNGVNASFLSEAFEQTAYPTAVTAGLTQIGTSYGVQANAYAIEALTEQWVGGSDCPATFY